VNTQALITDLTTRVETISPALLIPPQSSPDSTNGPDEDGGDNKPQAPSGRDPRRYKNGKPRYQFTSPTRLLGWVLQVQAWTQQNEYTFNIRTYNIRPDHAPIFRLAKSGNVLELRLLLASKQAAVTDVDSLGYTALHVCTREFKHSNL
jgi:hypothetical protein